MHASPWILDLQMDAEARRARLQQHLPFHQLAARIAERLTVLCCHKSQIDGTDFRRPVFSLNVGKELFDQFFNSPSGYRAQYFESPWAGLCANAVFMKAVSTPLIASGPGDSGLAIDFIRESLASPSAKAWLTERGKELDGRCNGCLGEWSAPSSGSVAEIKNNRWDVAPSAKGEWGRSAPYLKKLRVMGAFLDDRLNEFVPFDKRFRAEDIHRVGWS